MPRSPALVLVFLKMPACEDEDGLAFDSESPTCIEWRWRNKVERNRGRIKEVVGGDVCLVTGVWFEKWTILKEMSLVNTMCCYYLRRCAFSVSRY